jgi:hypothetical protein
MARWSVAISAHLWPYTITNVPICQNNMRQKGENETQLKRFTGSKIAPNLKNQHYIGIPVYVLDNSLQAGKKVQKWMPRATVGIYLGRSPRHGRNIALVLNPRTGLVSAQFHVQLDDLFKTVLGTKDEQHSLWKQKCGFAKDKRQKSATITKSIEKVKIPDTENDQLMPNEGPTDEVDVNITMEEVTQNEGATLVETEPKH